MFGRKCSLCGGKLNSKNVCKECGLDNTKSDKYYKMNRSSCDGMPLTHVHEDSWTEKRVANKTGKRKEKGSSAKKTNKGKISVLVSVLLVFVGIIPTVLGIFGNVIDTSFQTENLSYGYDPYAYLEKEHPKFGEQISYSLRSGQYIVGVHIAEGDYSATVFEDYDSVAVSDKENGIYLYEYQAQEENFLDDLRLFNGAVVTITSPDGLVLKTQNGQSQTQVDTIENPIKDTIILEQDQEYIVGEAFEAGVYDVYNFAEYGYVNLTFIEEDGTEWDVAGYDMGQEGMCGTSFRNMVLLEGMRIYVEGATVELEPSEMISSLDYSEYYAEYY